MFEKELSFLERQLDVPYPQRHAVIREIESDLLTCYEDLKTKGLCDEEAKTKAIRQFEFNISQTIELKKVHSPLITKLLLSIPHKSIRSVAERLSCIGPLAFASFAIVREIPMFSMMFEGGVPGMTAIVVIGAVLMFSELIRAVKLLVLRNHSQKNLNIDTSSVILGCTALIIFSSAWTLLGLYYTAQTVNSDHIDYALLVIGAKESVIPLLFSLFIASIVLLTHFTNRVALHRWKLRV